MNIQFTTKPYLPALVVSVVLLIMFFLPWVTASAGSVSESDNGTAYGWGYLTLIMSILGVLLSFVTPQKMRAMGLMGAGLLALIGVIVYWLRMHGDAVLYGVEDFVSPGFGLYIAGIAALAAIVIGIMDLRQPVQPSQPPPANPPAPPPPPQQ